jgi:hypothetical protein
MKTNIKSKIKKLAPWVLGGLLVWYLFRRFTSVKVNAPIGGDRTARTSDAFDYVATARATDMGRTLFAANLVFWRGVFTDTQSIDAIASMGYDAIMFSVSYESVYDFNTATFNWKDTDARLKRCAERGLLMFPKLVFPMHQRNFLKLFQKSDAALDSAGNWIEGAHTYGLLAPHVEKWGRFVDFARAFATRYQDLNAKGHIEAVIFGNAEALEFGYTHMTATQGAGTYQQKHNTLKRRFSELTSAMPGYDTVLEAGDLIVTRERAMFGYTDIGQSARWFKQNPVFESSPMDMDFTARQLQTAGRRSYMEITNESGNATLNTNAMKQAADRGVDVVGLAFIDPPEGLPMLRTVMDSLKSAGYKSKPKPALPSHNFTYNVSEMVSAGNYFGILSRFKAAYQNGIPPKITVNYDL